ncbi:MAG: tail protein X [Alphaproteobacteria bacterium]|nr:tail protein X [Alphaproteobacteria bacterium]
MTQQYIEHRTIDGDRWDQLAWRYYGDPHGYERIIRANPGVAMTAALPGGLSIRIPVIADAVIASAGLPPWKSNG